MACIHANLAARSAIAVGAREPKFLGISKECKEMQSHPTHDMPSHFYGIVGHKTDRITCEVTRPKARLQSEKVMKKPWRTCGEVAALISAREARALSTQERVVVRVHAFICRRCTRWEQQVKFMRQGISAWKNYKD